MRVHLKIKLKTLAAEAADIRREERHFNFGAKGRTRARRILDGKTLAPNTTGTATNGTPMLEGLTEAQRKRIERHLRKPSAKAMEIFWGLRGHRVNVVRPEARATQIAYGFLRGRTLDQIEGSAISEPNWKRVEELVKKYGEGDVTERMARFDAWRDPETETAAAA